MFIERERERELWGLYNCQRRCCNARFGKCTVREWRGGGRSFVLPTPTTTYYNLHFILPTNVQHHILHLIYKPLFFS